MRVGFRKALPNLQTTALNMQRIAVIGSSGSGKSTLAKQLGVQLNIQWIELDELFWQPHWQERSQEEFCNLVQAATASGTWVVDGNYATARSIIWPKATTIICLNYAFPLVLYRIFKRSIIRAATQQKLFAGNVETFQKTFLSRDSIIWWVLTTYHRRQRQYRSLLQSDAVRHIQVLEFTTPQQTAEFMSQLQSGSPTTPAPNC